METYNFIFIALTVLTTVSVALNMLLVWYIRRVMSQSSLIHNVTSDMLGALEDFSEHVNRVYELPLFYGDETLKELLEHSKELVQNIELYRSGFIFEIRKGEQLDNAAEAGATEEEG